MTIFPGEPWSVIWFPFGSTSYSCSGGERLQINGMEFLRAGYSFCPLAISVEALKGTQSTDRNQWPGLILSLSSTGLLTKGVLLALQWLSNTSALVSLLCNFVV